ncbi:T6SS immunity protein Tli3 family protein [Pectobacterium odoriferum]|uniref:T6SS immunity protein Tli3 family protein n=1 Tax=Pectobacterium odoriferum TaxID=78398 RepID=UPI0015DEFC2F|nr:hypothetical protein [Pectobacterium odoriferum]MBA0190696.1 hypothetical protein [Pectobacterium odoriferum]
MSNENKINSTSKGAKIFMIIAVLVLVLWILWNVVLSMIPTVGGSFGYGFPSGSGGRAIRDVEIDVDPQVVYRIDDHRFFTFEKYISCTSGGFVYYNDTNKKIKKLTGIDGLDKKPQNEVTISEPNGVMAFNGKFIYAASDNVIAYPGRNISYKYGYLNDFVVIENISNPLQNTGFKVSGSSYDTTTITDDAIYIQASNHSDKYEKYPIPKKSDDPEWVDASTVQFDSVSLDDHFHCNNDIKPRHVRYISN